MAAAPRVVSLLPSATEIVVALGLGEQLVGRSHECDFPAWVECLPVCTSTRLEKGLGSREIEDRVQAIVRQGLSMYEVDAPLLRSLRPEVIVTQSQCAVCAVTPRDLTDALATWVGAAPTLLSLAPETLGDVWSDLMRVGEATGRAEVARREVDLLQDRLERLRRRSAGAAHRPTVAAIEWIDPLMAAGNWVPELVEIAGGTPLFAAAGQHSPWLDWETLLTADPDAIVLMPCGYTPEQSLAEVDRLAKHAGWHSLRAVQQGRVFVVDGQQFFNRPGPRLVESAEIVASILGALHSGAERGEAWSKVPTAAEQGFF